VQGANVVCGTKRQHSGNMESSPKQARIETYVEDMDLDESGVWCFVDSLQRQSFVQDADTLHLRKTQCIE